MTCVDRTRHARGACGLCVAVHTMVHLRGGVRALVGVAGACAQAAPVPARLLCVPSDTDDCADAPCCQQACSDSPGGYECSCYAGYRLSADGCGCEGEPASRGGQGPPRQGPGGGSPCLCPASERRLSARLSGPACSLPGLWSLTSLTEWGLHPWLLSAWPPAGRVSAVTPTLGGRMAAAGASPISMAPGPLGLWA